MDGARPLHREPVDGALAAGGRPSPGCSASRPRPPPLPSKGVTLVRPDRHGTAATCWGIGAAAASQWPSPSHGEWGKRSTTVDPTPINTLIRTDPLHISSDSTGSITIIFKIEIRGAQPARRRDAAGQHGGHQGPARAFLDFGGRPRRSWSTTALDARRCRLLDFLRDVGKHVTVNQMLAKESVGRMEGETASPTPSSATCCCRPTTTVALHATTAASSRSAAPTSGATSPPAST